MTAPGKLRAARRVVAFLIAFAVMVVLGSAAHSYFVQEAWSIAAGRADGTAPADISYAERVAWMAHDLAGMFLAYGAITSVALCVAFLCAGALARFTGGRVWVFGIASASAVFAIFTAARVLLGTVGIFGARGATGLAVQMLVGSAAGVLFAKLTAPR